MVFFKIRCIGFTSWRLKFSALLDWFLHRTLFHGFDTLGSHLREEGSLDYDGGFVRLQVHLKFNMNIYRQQPHFVVVEEIVHKAPQRLRWAPHNLVGAWLHHSPMLALVDHRINLAASEFLQTVALILLCTSFLCRGGSFFYNSSSFMFLCRHKESFL
jgi:hypothetical protein